MKKKYIIPLCELVECEIENILGSSIYTEQPSIGGNHCSNCKWRFDGNEAWHCDHSVDNWTGEPFYEDCDYYK